MANEKNRWSVENEQMIRTQLLARGIDNVRVLDAIRSVPRELFVPPHLVMAAFEDGPLPIGHGQTISQPFIVALMTSQLKLQGHERVLEVGTGSGYQTAILARLAARVFTVDLEQEFTMLAGRSLQHLSITNVEYRTGDGISSFRDRAPFDAILCAAAPVDLPELLLEQLAVGGRCLIPVGAQEQQQLLLIERTEAGVAKHRLGAVRFVPLRRNTSDDSSY